MEAEARGSFTCPISIPPRLVNTEPAKLQQSTVSPQSQSTLTITSRSIAAGIAAGIGTINHRQATPTPRGGSDIPLAGFLRPHLLLMGDGHEQTSGISRKSTSGKFQK